MFSELEPSVIANEYLVLGTVEKKVWREHLQQQGTFEEIRARTADIENDVDVSFEPARWVYEGDGEEEKEE
jgi:hypothetical protein